MERLARGIFPGPHNGVLLVEREDGTWTLPATADSAGTCSIHPEFALTCSATHPDAVYAIKEFLADSGEPLHQQGAMSMESQVSPRDAQLKAQRVHEAFGDAAGAPGILNGETETDYRVRLVSKFQQHSKVFKDSDLAKIASVDVKSFGAMEDSIYKDALDEASNPTTIQEGVLIPRFHADSAGRKITKYVGDPNACWGQFNPPSRYVLKFLVPGASR
jgi:hypothetical protein